MKKSSFLSVFILGILLFVQNTGAQTIMNNPVIGIQYIGPSDKPVTPIVIGESKGDAEKFNRDILKRSNLEMTTIHIVAPPLMKELLSAVGKHGFGDAKENGSQPTAVVSLTIIVRDKEQRVLLERQAGIEMLEQFSRICKKDSALQSDIILFKTRMSQW